RRAQGPAVLDGLRLRAADGAHEPSSHGAGDDLHRGRPALRARLVLAHPRGPLAGRGRRGARAHRGARGPGRARGLRPAQAVTADWRGPGLAARLVHRVSSQGALCLNEGAGGAPVDRASEFVIDVRRLGLTSAPGSWESIARTVRAPEDLRIELIGVPAGDPVELDLRFESVVEGIFVSGSVRATAR